LRVVVTGGAGYIGSHVVLALLERGHAPAVIDDLSAGDAALLPQTVPLLRADLRDRATVESCFARLEPEAVIHLAGLVSVTESLADPLRYYDVNLGGSLQVIDACRRHGALPLVFSSTAAVYAPAAAAAGPVDEAAAAGPVSPYGRSKLLVEQILAEAGVTLPHAILRYFNVAGADPRLRCGPPERPAPNLIQRAAAAVATGEGRLRIFGTDYPTPDGTCLRDFIHVSDLAEIHVLALERLCAGEDPLLLNCGYGRGYSVRQVAERLQALAPGRLRLEAAPRRAGDLPAVVAAVDRLRRSLDWRPRHDDLDAILASALAWERRRAAPPHEAGRLAASV